MSAETRTNPDLAATTWSCERCLQRGEIEFDASTSFFDVQLRAIAAHREASPGCRSQATRLRLYDADRQQLAARR